MKKRFLGPLIVFITSIIVAYVIYREGVLPVNSQDKSPVIFVVNRGDSVNTIARNLHNAKLIRNPIVFFVVVKKLAIERSIQAGDFRLNRSMNTEEIARGLTHGTLDVWVTIVEGLRKEEIASIFSKTHSIPEMIFSKHAIEGYLFPDTYLVPTSADVAQVLALFKANYNRKITNEMKLRAKQLNFSMDEVLTLASVVEREARHLEDKKKVAAVFVNRLKEGMPLQADATVQYVLGYSEEEKTWWRKNISTEDLAINSPFNTYKNPGMPPAPISNPGLDAINGVLYAADVPYLYYISDKKGSMHYANTLDEHNRNIRRYLD